ncbi:MAG: hypothetical protein PUF39_02450 [Prevotellaceae bacterium]|nr:hypothetical protein [Prevotellaceae bacterium]
MYCKSIGSACFAKQIQLPIKIFKISGTSVRMDSKLIGSNIAQYSRYELIHRTLCKVLHDERIMTMLNPSSAKVPRFGSVRIPARLCTAQTRMRWPRGSSR